MGLFRAAAAMSTEDAATGVTLSGALANLNRDVEIRQVLLMRELGVVVGGKEEEEEEEIRRFRVPDTLTQAYSDAQAHQQALAEQGGGKKRKLLDEAAEAAKKWALPAGESLVDPNVAPFLAYNEEYFRHITPQDVADLVPYSATRPEDDPDFRIPALGRYYVLGECRREAHARTTPETRGWAKGRTTARFPLPSPSTPPLSSRFFIFVFCLSNLRKQKRWDKKN